MLCRAGFDPAILNTVGVSSRERPRPVALDRTSAPTRTMESPQKIGKFRILRLLGQGAMGQVFLAEDPLIDRRVAIKVMAAEGDDEARERFRNEARTAGQLSHPNIVQLYEFGFHLGQPYLVM